MTINLRRTNKTVQENRFDARLLSIPIPGSRPETEVLYRRRDFQPELLVIARIAFPLPFPPACRSIRGQRPSVFNVMPVCGFPEEVPKASHYTRVRPDIAMLLPPESSKLENYVRNVFVFALEQHCNQNTCIRGLEVFSTMTKRSITYR